MIAGDQMSGTQSLKWLSDQVNIGSGFRLSLIDDSPLRHCTQWVRAMFGQKQSPLFFWLLNVWLKGKNLRVFFPGNVHRENV